MGDYIELRDVEVIQDGLLQLDFYNETQNKWFRVFVEPEKMFGLIGEAMQNNFKKYLEKACSELVEILE